MTLFLLWNSLNLRGSPVSQQSHRLYYKHAETWDRISCLWPRQVILILTCWLAPFYALRFWQLNPSECWSLIHSVNGNLEEAMIYRKKSTFMNWEYDLGYTTGWTRNTPTLTQLDRYSGYSVRKPWARDNHSWIFPPLFSQSLTDLLLASWASKAR